jgi:RNA polymerase sigma factor for flagellar operon FliA
MANVRWEHLPASPVEVETLTLSYLPFVQTLAGRVYRRLPQGTSVDLRDLTQAGIVGLVKAARTYDPQAGVSFLIYATFRIRGEMLDTLRGLDGASRQSRRLERRMKTVAGALAFRLNREPTREEMLQELGLDGSEARDKTSALAGVTPAYTTDHAAAQLPTRTDSHPDFLCAHAETRTWLGRAARTLSQRNRRLIWLYYSGEKTMKEIALLLRVNESRISQMHKSALRAMAKALGDSGIRSSRDLGACS